MHPQRAVIIQDLQPGGLLYQCDNIMPEEIFPWYQQLLMAFADIVFDQFKALLKDNQLAATKRVHIWQFKNSSILSMTKDSIQGNLTMKGENWCSICTPPGFSYAKTSRVTIIRSSYDHDLTLKIAWNASHPPDGFGTSYHTHLPSQ
jgi:hypothetical protein